MDGKSWHWTSHQCRHSADTLSVNMRHRQLSTTELYYGGASPGAQSAAADVAEKLSVGCEKSELVGESVTTSSALSSSRSERLYWKQFKKLSPAGLEPTTYGLKVRCSTN
jgi:hypothetical protein